MKTTGQIVGEKAGYLVSETVAQSGGVVFGVGKGIVGHPLVSGAATIVGKGIGAIVGKVKDPALHAKIGEVGSKIGTGITDTAMKSKHIRDIKAAIDEDKARIKVAFSVIDTDTGEVTTPNEDEDLDSMIRNLDPDDGLREHYEHIIEAHDMDDPSVDEALAVDVGRTPKLQG